MEKKPRKIEIAGGSVYLCYEDENTNVSHETKVLHNKEYKYQKTALNKAHKLLSDKEYSFIGIGKNIRDEEYYQQLIIRRGKYDRWFKIGLKKKLLRQVWNPTLTFLRKVPVPVWDYDLNNKEKELLKKYLGDFVTAEDYEDGAYGIYKEKE